jgi:hypothetical protein
VADNTTLSTAVGTGDTIRTEDRTTYKTPVSLIDVGGTSAEALIGDSGVAMPVRGLAAEDAAASGNPVPAGGRYDSTPRSLEDGDRGEIALDTAGQQYVVDTAVKTAVEIMDDWDESDRAKVNPIVGQAGVAAGAGAVGATVQRTTLASDDPAVTALQVIDDWDESDRAKVNIVAGQAGITAGAGAVGASTPRVTLASDDPGVALLGTIDADTGGIATSVAVMDDWDESDRAKVNPIVGQAGVAAGAGSVGTTTQRVTLASDDPGVALLGTIDTDTGNIATSVGVMDDWDNGASDGASVSGDVAHDGVDAGEPVKIGAKAIAYGSNPTAVAAADRTDLYANRHGVLMVLGGVPGVITKEWTFADADGAQTDAALVTVSAGTKIAVTNIAAICDNANTGDVAVRVGFAAASLSAAATSGIAGIVMSHPGIASGSGYNRGDGSGVLGVGADGEDLRITCEDPAGGSIRIIASYFEIAS